MKSYSWQFDTHGTVDDVLRWREQSLPDPGPGQALVKIKAVGMNVSDLNYVLGRHFPTKRFPSCLGGEAVGEIVALGPPNGAGTQAIEYSKLTVGMRVGTLSGRVDSAAMGVYRDIGLYEQAALAPVPDSYSDAEGAALWTAVLTIGGAMEVGGLTAETTVGKNVLITAGAGGMGVLALKLARHWGATTITTTRNVAKIDGLGLLADYVIVCNDSESLSKGVQQATNGRGADLVLDPVGTAFYPGILVAAANGGRIVSYECITGEQANFSIMKMMMKNVSFHGFTIFQALNDPVMLNRLLDIGMDNAQALRPVISRICSLSETPHALEVLGQSEHLGKIVLTT